MVKIYSLKKTVLVLLFTALSFAQSSIIVSGTKDYTVGETFPIMQQIDTVIEVSLGVPKFEIPKEEPKKEVVKKKSFIQKLMEFFKKLINKKQ